MAILLRDCGSSDPDHYSAALKDFGLSCLSIPILRVIPKPITPSLPDPLLYQALVITSANSIRHLPPNASLWLTHFNRFYTVGPSTSRSLLARHPSANVLCPPSSSGATLAEFIAKDTQHPSPRVLFICGEPHRPELAEILSANNIQVDKLIVYESEILDGVGDKIREACGNRQGVWLCIFSPAGARAVLSQLRSDINQFRIAVIGQTTAAVFDDIVPIVVATSPTPEGFKQAIQTALISPEGFEQAIETALI
uniref:Tetrapyrrole biosynthesis uroporphyrinogen III synthase domain-containing protein n=1 Tax=Spongospora subterranea TaxID=70186 RepID=A0A0H5RAT6_9EUKA|eukprot:CRZ10901.1 hypothetical protein [Spongospora subterranea]